MTDQVFLEAHPWCECGMPSQHVVHGQAICGCCAYERYGIRAEVEVGGVVKASHQEVLDGREVRVLDDVDLLYINVSVEPGPAPAHEDLWSFLSK